MARLARIKVKPALSDGELKKVLDQVGRVIPAKGIEVPRNSFYSRLIKSKDLVLVQGQTKKLNKKTGE